MDFRLTVPELASNCWPATPQSFVNEIFEKTRGELSDISGVIISETTPDPADQDKLWVKIDGGGFPVGTFIFNGGEWLWPVEGYDKADRRFWRGNIADLPFKDGGEAGPVTSTTGPFWELDEDMNGRVAIGVGDLPSGAAIAVNDQGGNDVSTLENANIPAHRHPIATNDGTGVTAPSEVGSFGVTTSEAWNWDASTASTKVGYSRNNEDATATPASFTNLPPYQSGYWIKRTDRKYYRG